MQGYPDQAVERVHRTLKEVVDHPVGLTGALTWGIGVFFWVGDLTNAETHIDCDNMGNPTSGLSRGNWVDSSSASDT